jgi:hypothetical protein
MEKELLEYELSTIEIYSMKCKGFCWYHHANFDRLSENQKVFEHHYKNLIIINSNYIGATASDQVSMHASLFTFIITPDQLI